MFAKTIAIKRVLYLKTIFLFCIFLLQGCGGGSEETNQAAKPISQQTPPVLPVPTPNDGSSGEPDPPAEPPVEPAPSEPPVEPSNEPAKTTNKTLSVEGYAYVSLNTPLLVKAWVLGKDDEQTEVIAANAPVLINTDGYYDFEIDVSDALDLENHAIIFSVEPEISNGTTQLLSIGGAVPDFSPNNEIIELNLSYAGSITANVVSRLTRTGLGFHYESVFDRIESQLTDNLADDPNDPNSSLATFRHLLAEQFSDYSPLDRNLVMNQLVHYMSANLSSSSQMLDAMMLSDTPPFIDIPASFKNIETSALNGLFSEGPSELVFIQIGASEATIENSGVDYTELTIEQINAVGEFHAQDQVFSFAIEQGQGTLSTESIETINGQAQVILRSTVAGPIIIEVSNNQGDRVGLLNIDSVDLIADLEDTVSPRVVTAGALSNTEILVVFSEAMQGGVQGAENPERYTISANPGDTGVGGSAVAVVRTAQLLAPDFSTVLLTTFSQSEITYSVRVIDVKDVAGNPMAVPIPGITPGIDDPSSGIYVGVAPTPADIQDYDNDGVTDTDEQFGWSVTTTNGEGETRTIFVSADPRFADTDLDGISDADERQAGLDPRSPDTDGDTLDDNFEWNVLYSDPKSVDTDGDGIEDGFEYGTFKTSPILADTDGDQLPDFDEVVAGNRNPLKADLPSPNIEVGNMSLALDIRFTYTNTNGENFSESKTVDQTLLSSQSSSIATSSERSTLNTLQNSIEIAPKLKVAKEPSFSIGGKIGSSQGSEQGSTFVASEESSRSSQETYQESLSFDSSVSAEFSVVREVVGASLKVDISIENAGDIPFTMRNIQLSVLTQDPNNRKEMIPIAAMTPENESFDEINIGVLGNSIRGPFTFSAVDVFPAQIEELMKNPRGLIVQLANFDIVDEQGRNFSYSSQEILDKTAALSFDLGNGRQESFRVATSSQHNPNTGEPVGITLGYALQQILGIEGKASVVDGGNGIAETSPVEGDIALIAIGDSVEPKRAIIVPGESGDLLTLVTGGDDYIELSDYETRVAQDTDSIREGGDNIVSSLATAGSDDVQEIAVGERVSGGAVIISAGEDGILDSVPSGDDLIVRGQSGNDILYRFRDVETNAVERRFWGLFSAKDRIGVDFENMILRAGDDLEFVYVQDKDNDGVFASTEKLHNTSDRSFDTDEDLLSDFEELQIGWYVEIRNPLRGYQVYPNPVFPDSDRDLIVDIEERACLIDPRQRDSDLDGLSDYEEITGTRFIEGVETPMVSRDRAGNFVYDITPYLGNSTFTIDGEFLRSHEFLNEDNGRELCSITTSSGQRTVGYATNPHNPDTDGDGVSDYQELFLGLHPNFTPDGPDFLDDDGDGLSNNEELIGTVVYINGEQVLRTSNPNLVDTDGDELPDLLERYIGSDPNNVDTDSDGIRDFDEYQIGGNACITKTPNVLCENFRLRSQLNYNDFIRQCEAADQCGYDESSFEQNSLQYGTNLSEADSDFDGVADPVELFGNFVLRTINRGTNEDTALPHPVSNPLLFDSDTDGLSDGVELAGENGVIISNPRNADTDDDGVQDNSDQLNIAGTLPNRKDRRVRLQWESITALGTCDGDNSTTELEQQGRFYTKFPLGGEIDVINFANEDSGDARQFNSGEDVLAGNAPVYFAIMVDGENDLFARSIDLKEDDTVGGDEIDNLEVRFSLNCSPLGCNVTPSDPVVKTINQSESQRGCFTIRLNANDLF